jgi:Protein of unknown function (DUF2380)
MRRSCLTVHALFLLGLFWSFQPAFADSIPSTSGVTIEDFQYLDTSGELANQADVHQKRLRDFMTALRRDVAADAEQTQGEARIRIVGAIQKMSTLIQWAKVTVIDLNINRPLWDKLFTFRGDNDEAWGRAEVFISQEIREALAASPPATLAAAPAQIGVAVFDFELEDTSAAAVATGVAAADVATLADVTTGVRDLLAQSGRYHVVDVSGTSEDAVRRHALRDCGGCEVPIARELGADQSLVSVVRRVSRTEYTIGFQIRDAHTGAVVSRGDSGLRMGADYSWKRGAEHLIRNRVLENQSPQ